MTRIIDITPTTHLVMSMRNQSMTPLQAVAELIDNSFDARATRVSVVINGTERFLAVHDNGVGAPDPSKLVRIGDRQRNDSSGSGRYGIGAKDAICALGTFVRVLSRRNGLATTIFADFEKITETGKWQADQSQAKTSPRHSGLTVEIGNLKKIPYAAPLVENVSNLFGPALRRGKQIEINGSLVPPPPEVEVTNRIEGEGVFRGRQYQWWAGIIPVDRASDSGWHFEFHHRCLEATTCNRSYGTNGMDIHRFYGVITLLEPEVDPHTEPSEEIKRQLWPVNKHKTSSEELEDLCEHLFPEVEGLLTQAASEYALTLEAEIADEVGKGLTDALGDLEVAKEKRTKLDEGDGEGVEPRNTGRRRRQAIKIQDGNGSIVFRGPSFSGKKFNIRFTDEHVFGRVTGDRRANVVYFGKNHPYWAANLHDRNVIYLAAMAMLAGHAATTQDENQPIMSAVVPYEAGNERFFYTFGNIAAQVAQKDALAVNA